MLQIDTEAREKSYCQSRMPANNSLERTGDAAANADEQASPVSGKDCEQVIPGRSARSR